MDRDAVAALAFVGSIGLACVCVVWWVYAEFPSRDEHLFAGEKGTRPGPVRAPAALWFRLGVAVVFVACTVAGFATGTAALPLALGGGATLLVWLVRPRTAYGRRVAAAESRRNEKW